MTASTPLLGPNQKLPLTHAAMLLGVPVRSLRRVKAALIEGQPPNCRDPWLLVVARLYVKAEESATDVRVKSVFSALDQPVPPGQQVPIAPIARPALPGKKTSKRKAATKVSPLPEIREGERPSDTDRAEVAKRFWEKVAIARSSAGKVPWKQIHELAQWLIKAGQPPHGVLHGHPLANLDLSKIMRFGSVGDFLSRASLSDVWPFVLSGLDARPVDLFAATELELRYGYVVLLAVEEWGSRMQSAIRDLKAFEASQAEAIEIGGVSRKTKKKPAPKKLGSKKVRTPRPSGL